MLALGSLNPTVKPNNLLKVVYHSVHCLLHLHTFEVEDWKADSQTREVGARELSVDDTDMVNKDSMLMFFESCLRQEITRL